MVNKVISGAVALATVAATMALPLLHANAHAHGLTDHPGKKTTTSVEVDAYMKSKGVKVEAKAAGQ